MQIRLTRTLAAAALAALLAVPSFRAIAEEKADSSAQNAATSAEPNTLSDEEKQQGFTLLFDGKTADGWRNYKGDKISDGWKIVDGALTRAEKGAGDIITKGQYDAFELLIDYKISKGGNSGIMFHVTEDAGAPYETGPEIQIQDNQDGHDPQKAGWLYQLYPAEGEADATKPAGEWNHLRILIAKAPAKSVIEMNGKKYSEFVVGSDDWNQKVAASKFASMPGFGKAGKGYICLQDHGDEVAYRSIKIRKIAEEK